jgi:quercetin dioxygenase-like cupin family protein
MASRPDLAAVATALGEGERLWFLGTLATIRVPGASVERRFDLTEFLFPHHASPPLHTHPVDETFILLEGDLTVVTADRRFRMRDGGITAFPAGAPHSFRVDSETARALVLSTPAGLERLYRDGGVPATAATLPPAGTPRPSPDELQRIFAASGQENLGPPLGPDD